MGEVSPGRIRWHWGGRRGVDGLGSLRQAGLGKA
jgi:hypothetical protein